MADRWTKNEKSLEWNEGSTSINLGHEQILVNSYFPGRINPLSFLSYCYDVYFSFFFWSYLLPYVICICVRPPPLLP